MRTKIHILFKLIGDRISEFRVLKSGVKVPPPKPRPENYNDIRAKHYLFNMPEDFPQDKLPFAKLKINVIPALPGLIGLVLCFFVEEIWIFAVSALLSVAGAVFIVVSLLNRERRSVLLYNAGAGMFNSGRYKKAKGLFAAASALDEHNEMAEYASNKVSFYE
jgi:hypothetical protein